MIDAPRLLKDLQRLLKELEDDLRVRVGEVAEIDAGLREQYRAAREAGRTGDAYEMWRDELITQVAAAWILGCVFVRFLEDNRLIDTPLLSGPGERRQRALDEHELYFKQPDRRTHSDRDYLLHVFETVRALPAAVELFDHKHNPLWELGPSGDGATTLLRFWQRVDPDTGALAHDFTDLPPLSRRARREGVGGEGNNGLNTRFLGDLYQDLSEGARKKYALLQTPEFVEEFILDRALTPAIEEFGFKTVRLIDPTCGSGHFLLGAFRRLFELWVAHEPGTNPRELAQRALNQVYGVDLNPYAVAIARFRLLIAAFKASDVHSIRRGEAPAFHVNVAAGDSLLHGRRFATAAESLAAGGGRSMELDIGSGAEQLAGRPGIGHAYFAEDMEALNQILGQQYHAVVGNPPYITVKDKALNQLYRDGYHTCHRQYSVAVPFTERFFQLALGGRGIHHEGTKDTKGSQEELFTDDPSPPGRGAGVRGKDEASAGFVGMITANSFMKREFGKKLIEGFFPGVDLTHVIDTSGAYIPGHGTPTVILFGRDRSPIGDAVRTVMGIKGEPATPEDPAKGLVWSAIVGQVDRAGSESEWVSVADTSRQTFSGHPWSIGGGGAAELRETLDGSASRNLAAENVDIGFLVITGEDNCLLVEPDVLARIGLTTRVAIGDGEALRDWACEASIECLWPYDQFGADLSAAAIAPYLDYLWPYRTTLKGRKAFGVPVEQKGLRWWDIREVYRERLKSPNCITFAFVATHNHFVLDRGGKVFNRSAPVIKLPAGATENEHLALIGLLNSSSACFWMKQVFHNKGGQGINEGLKAEAWEKFYEFTGTGLKQFPVTDEKPLDLAAELDRLALELAACSPSALVAEEEIHHEGTKRTKVKAQENTSCPSCLRGETLTAAEVRQCLDQARDHASSIRRRMIALQEELDWRCYRLYGITKEKLTLDPASVPEINLGERAFEIVMARQKAAGELETTWFERHRSKPITEIPAHWPEDYRRLVERRIALIEQDRNVGLMERPEYKRRWNQEPWEAQEQRALRGWLLDRLEAPAYWPSVELQTTGRLSDRAATDTAFMQVAELYRGRPDFEVHALVAELIESESVPFLPVLRHKPTGLRKREIWERTWALQRREDAIDLEVEREMGAAHHEDTNGEQEIHHEGTKGTKVEQSKIASCSSSVPGESSFPIDSGVERGMRHEDPKVEQSKITSCPSCLRGEISKSIQEEQKRRKQQEIGDIPAPPKYASADFLSTTVWRLRGALDVPKERFVSYPHCSKATDPSLVVAWAGWDHLQQAQALAAYYLSMKEQEGWTPERLSPLLAGLLELIPWVKQWHNEPDPNFSGARMGDYFESFVDEEARELRLTPDQIRGWTPPASARARRGSKISVSE